MLYDPGNDSFQRTYNRFLIHRTVAAQFDRAKQTVLVVYHYTGPLYKKRIIFLIRQHELNKEITNTIETVNCYASLTMVDTNRH